MLTRRHVHTRYRTDAPGRWPFVLGQGGSILMATIIAITVIASLGTAIYSFVSTATLTQIGSMNDTKAYYLAESGGHYAIKRLAAIDSADTAVRNALLAELASAPYVITDAGQFSLQSFTYTSGAGFAEYRFTAKGTSIDASVSRLISYVIKVPDVAGVNITFDGSGSTLNANNWNVSGDADLDTDDQKVEMNDGHGDTQISLNWTNASSTMPNLLDVWNESGGLLTYEAQVKVRLGNDHDVMAGISFRLNTQGNANIHDDSFYGVSYLWCKDHSDLPNFCGSASSKTYLVFWKQASNGTQTVIGKQLASSVTSNLVSSNELVDWATLVVRVQEQFNPTSGVRENLIYAFAGIPSTTPKGTIHWDYSKYTAVKWKSSFIGTDCSSTAQKSCAADTTFTTANFGAQPRDEIGLHAFGDEEGEVADLALRFNFNGGEATSY